MCVCVCSHRQRGLASNLVLVVKVKRGLIECWKSEEGLLWSAGLIRAMCAADWLSGTGFGAH